MINFNIGFKKIILLALLLPVFVFAQEAGTLSKDDIQVMFPGLNAVELEQVYQRMMYEGVTLESHEQVIEMVNEIKGVDEGELVRLTIDNTKVTEISERGYIFSFDLKNNGTAVGGLKYRVGLHSLTEPDTEIFWHELVADEIALSEGGSRTFEHQVSIPNNFVGDYILKVEVGDESGQVISTSFADRFPLNLSGDISPLKLNVAECRALLGDDEFYLSQGVDLSTEEKLTLRCLVTNSADTDVVIYPKVTNHLRNQWGEVINDVDLREVVIPANTVNYKLLVSIPTVAEPQAYDAVVSLSTGNGLLTDIIPVHYVIQGESATIQELVSDKIEYLKNEIANVSLTWTGQVDAFEGSRANEGRDTYSTTVFANILLKNSGGEVCGSVSNFELKQSEIDVKGRQIFAIPVGIDCSGVLLSAELKNANGEVLFKTETDLSTTLETTEEVLAEDEETISDLFSTKTLLIVIGLAIAGIVFLIIYSRHKRVDIAANLMIVFVVGWMALVPVMAVYAERIQYSMWHAAAGAWNTRHALDLYFTGPTGSNLTFNINDSITVGSWIENATCANSLIRGYFQIAAYRNGSLFYNNVYNNYVSKSSLFHTFSNLQPGSYRVDVVWAEPGCRIITGYDNRIPPNPRLENTYCNRDPGRVRSYYFTVANPPPAVAPSSITATCSLNANSPVAITWPAVSGATHYALRVDYPGDPAPHLVQIDNHPATSYNSFIPAAGTAYTAWVHACNAGGCSAAAASTNFTCNPAPVVTLNANPDNIGPGSSSNLTWTVEYATSCTASGGWGGDKSVAGGSESVSPVASSVFNLACTGPGGTGSATENITMPSGSLTAGTCEIPINGTGCNVNVNWNSADFLGSRNVSQDLTQFSSAVSGSATRSITPDNRTFTLRDTGSAFSLTAIAGVSCAAGGVWVGNSCMLLPVIAVVSNPDVVRKGDTAPVSVTVTSPTDLSCVVSGAVVANFTHTGSINPVSYQFTSEPMVSARLVEVTCTHDTYPEVTGSGSARINVIPSIEEI